MLRLPWNDRSPNDGTVIGHMSAAFTRLQALLMEIDAIRADVSNAYNLAVKEGKPAVQIRFFQGELDTLKAIAGELIMPMVQKLAEIETGSRG